MLKRSDRTYYQFIKLNRREEILEIFDKKKREGKHPMKSGRFFHNLKFTKISQKTLLPQLQKRQVDRISPNIQQNLVQPTWPECCIGIVCSKMKNKKDKWGSGVFFEGYNVLTCRSLLANSQSLDLSKSTYFFPSFSNSQFERLQCQQTYFNPIQKQDEQQSHPDLAVLDLRCDNKSNSLGYVSVAFDLPLKSGQVLELIGHQDLDNTIQFFKGSCKVTGLASSGITYKIVNHRGNTILPGTGIYSKNKDRLRLVGLHCQIKDDIGIGCYLSQEKRLLINGWIRKETVTIDLASKKITENEVKALAQHQNKVAHVINLQNTTLSADDISILAKTNWSQLEKLVLGRNKIGPTGLEILLTRDWSHLIRLNLSECSLGDSGVQRLAQNSWTNLTSLVLSNNSITSSGLRRFLLDNSWPVLQELYLASNQIDNEGAYHFARILIPNLLRINLDWNNIGDEGVQLLCKGMKHLEHLSLYNNDVYARGADLLRARKIPSIVFANLNQVWHRFQAQILISSFQNTS